MFDTWTDSQTCQCVGVGVCVCAYCLPSTIFLSISCGVWHSYSETQAINSQDMHLTGRVYMAAHCSETWMKKLNTDFQIQLPVRFSHLNLFQDFCKYVHFKSIGSHTFHIHICGFGYVVITWKLTISTQFKNVIKHQLITNVHNYAFSDKLIETFFLFSCSCKQDHHICCFLSSTLSSYIWWCAVLCISGSN